MASSSLLVKNVESFISLPLQSTVIPCVNEASHQDSQEDAHFGQSRGPQSPIHDGPGIQEDEFDVEQNEEDGCEVELDRQPADGQRERLVSALERSQFDRARILSSERGRQENHRAGNRGRQHETDGNPDVFAHRKATLAGQYTSTSRQW